jgi:hypothetical protein
LQAEVKLKPILIFHLGPSPKLTSLLLWSIPAPLLYLTLHLPALALDQLDKNNTMPALMSLPMPFHSPLTSTLHHHVSEHDLTLLITTVHPLDQVDVDIAQDLRAQTRPAPARIGMDARQDAPERDRTSPCPVDSALALTSPCTCTLTSTSGTKWTRSPDLARPVAVVTDDDHPPLLPECEDDDDRHRPPFSAPSSPTHSQ